MSISGVLLFLPLLGLCSGQTVQLNCDQVPGALKQIDAGNGQVVGVNANENIYTLYSGRWTQIPGSLSHISVGPGGLWGVNRNNNIYKLVGADWVLTDARRSHKTNGFNTKDTMGGGSFSVYYFQLTSHLLFFILFPGLLKQIDAGGAQFISGANMNDDIFCLPEQATVSAKDGSALPWNNIAGKLKYYSCNTNSCWGVNSADDIFYRFSVTPSSCSGSRWQQVEGKLAMIEVGSDGSVFGVNSVGDAYQRNGITASNPIGTSWSQLKYKAHKFSHLSYDLGLLWILTKDQMILRCKL
ncbi:fish-egg lectin-like [Pleurodeles waltl]|uniref:fish-egg lectin-like n=1 Tax=Pleurodeles waltl TaxID=8319 RepID=UPI003709853C